MDEPNLGLTQMTFANAVPSQTASSMIFAASLGLSNMSAAGHLRYGQVHIQQHQVLLQGLV